MSTLNLLKKSTLLMAALAFSASALSLTLQEAKDQLLVGEKRNGYLGVVVSSQPTEALVLDVNTKRQSAYQDIADRNDLTLEQVEGRAGLKNLERTAPGHLIEHADGTWVKK
ncbi:Putative uncharacterized protein ydbL, may be related to amine metabolism [Pseudoalteromonas luteoviolacea B = ATCC 29581]|nr:Putative uncharacterized protein ydbL, may be related to amine metabolism [Pseudoalteromonas luteoviolacea B = ATCC 29581]